MFFFVRSLVYNLLFYSLTDNYCFIWVFFIFDFFDILFYVVLLLFHNVKFTSICLYCELEFSNILLPNQPEKTLIKVEYQSTLCCFYLAEIPEALSPNHELCKHRRIDHVLCPKVPLYFDIIVQKTQRTSAFNLATV